MLEGFQNDSKKNIYQNKLKQKQIFHYDTIYKNSKKNVVYKRNRSKKKKIFTSIVKSKLTRIAI